MGTSDPAAPPLWDATVPRSPRLLPGIEMAGFRDRDVPTAGHLLVPHPAVTLVVDFGDAAPVVDDAAGGRHRGSLVAGLGLGDAVRVRGQDVACVQVRLSPLVAGAVLGCRLDELGGSVVALGDLWGREAARLSERLHAAATWDDRFSAVTEAVAVRLGDGAAVEPEVARVWRLLRASRGRARIGALAEAVGWSRTRLWSRCRAQLGASTKQAASLIRFDHAVHELAAGRGPAAVAADAGYADQSHLARDVMARTGVTPGVVAHEPYLAVDDAVWSRG